MFKLLLRVLQWAEGELARVEQSNVAKTLEAEAAIELQKLKKAASEAEQAAAAKIRGVLQSLRNN